MSLKSKKKNILIVSTEFPPSPGGIGSHAYALADLLQKDGNNVTVATDQDYADDKTVHEFNSNQDFKVIRTYPTPSIQSFIKKVLRLARIVRRTKSDLIIGTGKHASWFAYLTAKITFRKLYLIGHGGELVMNMTERAKKNNRRVYSRADGLIYVSQYSKNAAEKFGINNPNSIVIHNGADNSIFYREDENVIKDFREIKGLTKQFSIVTVGNVTDRKGQEWIIRSLPKIIKETPNAHYYCIGLPTIKGKLDKIIDELGIHNHVHFLGRLTNEEMRLWLNSCDLFAMTSAYANGDFEGFGIAVIEAALCGSPALVTRNSGVFESIEESQTGVAVNEEDTNEIANQIIKLSKNQNLLEDMARNAQNRAERYFTWSHQIERYKEFIL